MLGQMMRMPLTTTAMLLHAERHHGEREIVSRRVEGDLHRYTYRDMAARARRLARALERLGVAPADRVGTLAWNGYRHLELYYAVSGIGAVLTTINPRLYQEQIGYIAGHAGCAVLLVELSFLAQARLLQASQPGLRHVVVLCGRVDMPADQGLLCYEELLAAEADDYAWPVLDEAAASSLCYTSGTTGEPKGVLYSHRSTVLHALSAALPDAMNCAARDVLLPLVPMFHVNAWGLPYIACMVGAKLVLPGPALDGAALHALCEAEGVTFGAGVPTVWQGLLTHVEQSGQGFATLRRMLVAGTACPPALMAAYTQRYGVTVSHAWGMTELSPIGTVCAPKAAHAGLPEPQRRAVAAKQGRALFGVDLKVVGPDGAELPWDGVQAGDLYVRGPWVAQRYFGDACSAATPDGWFATGDVAHIDADGYIQITDRSKDVIKSGGEWISSIALENIAMAHPGVALAACVAVVHEKWGERPLLVVARKPGAALDAAQLLAFYGDKVARWWIPEHVVFVEAIPMGATGKILKNQLRKQYRNYLEQT